MSRSSTCHFVQDSCKELMAFASSSGVIHHFKSFPAHTTTTVENQACALVLPKVAQDPPKIALAVPVGETRPAHGVDLQLLVAELPHFGGSGGTTIVILGDCWGLCPFAVQVAGEAAVRHDEVCAWRPVAHVLMFWLGLLNWVVFPSKTPASFNASMTQGVAVSGRCSPSTKRYTISNLLVAEAAAQASLPRGCKAEVLADAVPGRGLWLGTCQQILGFELNLMIAILKEHVFRIQWFYRWPVPHIVGFCFGSVWTVRTCQHILEYCLSLQGFCVAGGANLQMFAQQPSKVMLIKPG